MFASVLLKNTGSFAGRFDYAIPPDLADHLHRGDLVEVGFRNTSARGIVWEIRSTTEAQRPKSMERVAQPTMLQPWQFPLAQWIADYYRAPLVKVVESMISEKLWNGTFDPSQHKIRTLSLGSKIPKGKTELAVTHALQQQKKEYEEVKKIIPSLTPSSLRKLVTNGIITVEEGGYQAPYFKQRNSGDPLGSEIRDVGRTLTPSQERALQTILQEPIGKPYLLFGPPASGKTEIYLRLALHVAKAKKQVLILVPEIALTPQLVSYFSRVFGARIAVIHSQLNDTERCIEWERLRTGEAQVAIGSRIALFAPFQHLGCICVDEEHEWTYKSEQTPRYHARDVAIQLGELTKSPVILGSATPSIESFTYAKVGRYALVRVERIEKSALVPVETGLKPVSLAASALTSLEPPQKFNGKYRVESTRLKGWDYASKGAYFVTICTKDRKHFFGEILDNTLRGTKESDLCQECWEDLPNHYSNCILDAFVIMPNHVHGIIFIEDEHTIPVETGLKPVSTNTKQTKQHALSEIVRAFKTFTARRINEYRKTLGQTFWQPRFYDHIIRDEQSLYQIREYIRDNPKNWEKDKENEEGLRM